MFLLHKFIEKNTIQKKNYSSKNLGKSVPNITLRSIPSPVIIPKRTTPPEEPSLDMANATAENEKKNLTP